MAASSEEVLLVVKHVRQKKQDGTLYLMAERIAWGPEGKDRFSVSHLYSDIRCQKISPDGKAKIQLQLVLHTGETSTFHFAGESTALRDRDAAKDLLQQLLPKFKRRANKELEEKNRMLQEDPVLFQLYKDLVVSQVISAEEFWANRLSLSSVDHSLASSKQEVGISAAFLADVRPQTDGCNGLRYNLTADIIESIFRTYPAVKQKYAENVPHNLTEKEFWTRFFQSHYFHRDRISTGSQDLFSECARQDEKGLKSMVIQGVRNPLVDLLSLEDKTLDEGYGLPSGPSSSQAGKSVKENSNSAIIKRFNHHSAMVLAAGLRKQGSPGAQCVACLGPQVKLQEAIEYEDLERDSGRKTVALKLKKSDRYSHGPVPVQSQQYTTSQDIINSVGCIRHEMANYRPSLTQVLSSSGASTAIAALSPGGLLMQGGTQQAINQMVPNEVQSELKHLYTAAGELLRHFWSCFPVNTPFLEEKVVKMRTNLERFQMTKLRPFQEKAQRQYLSTNFLVVSNKMADLVYEDSGLLSFLLGLVRSAWPAGGCGTGGPSSAGRLLLARGTPVSPAVPVLQQPRRQGSRSACSGSVHCSSSYSRASPCSGGPDRTGTDPSQQRPCTSDVLLPRAGRHMLTPPASDATARGARPGLRASTVSVRPGRKVVPIRKADGQLELQSGLARGNSGIWTPPARGGRDAGTRGPRRRRAGVRAPAGGALSPLPRVRVSGRAGSPGGEPRVSRDSLGASGGEEGRQRGLRLDSDPERVVFLKKAKISLSSVLFEEPRRASGGACACACAWASSSLSFSLCRCVCELSPAGLPSGPGSATSPLRPGPGDSAGLQPDTELQFKHAHVTPERVILAHVLGGGAGSETGGSCRRQEAGIGIGVPRDRAALGLSPSGALAPAAGPADGSVSSPAETGAEPRGARGSDRQTPCSHVLAELDSLDPLLSALRLDSSRLKCTCLAASRRWLALGTSAGGLHLIQREGWKQRLILTHKEGAITQVACCPHDEDFVAVALSRGSRGGIPASGRRRREEGVTRGPGDPGAGEQGCEPQVGRQTGSAAPPSARCPRPGASEPLWRAAGGALSPLPRVRVSGRAGSPGGEPRVSRDSLGASGGEEGRQRGLRLDSDPERVVFLKKAKISLSSVLFEEPRRASGGACACACAWASSSLSFSLCRCVCELSPAGLPSGPGSATSPLRPGPGDSAGLQPDTELQFKHAHVTPERVILAHVLGGGAGSETGGSCRRQEAGIGIGVPRDRAALGLSPSGALAPAAGPADGSVSSPAETGAEPRGARGSDRQTPCSHVLAELDSLDPLLSALRLDSSRLKCTCLAASRRWLALGTSAGGLHLIQREGWKQRLILTHKLERRGRPERVCMSWEHRGHDVTALCWDTSSLRLFVGDSVGKVSCLRVGSSRTGKARSRVPRLEQGDFSTSCIDSFVIFPVQTITTVDSRVVQLGYQDGRLLVSSLTRCYLCDTEREKFWRIGNKERDGEYGACFFPQTRSSGGTSPLICCARPGSRVWEASFSGEVLSTHQFKQLLACAPLPLVTHR
ncbi:TF2H1 factor, partial [Atractosteus spatula]|nr:TF2H1 factor [Atractosteus spatula]